MPIYESILDTIGKTPFVKVQLKKSSWELWLKLEKFNPGQSIKDRIALNMITQAEKKGLLKKGGTIIESSSGNTATGLAMIAAARGYHFIAVVDHHASKEKIDIIRAYGGEIKFVEGQYAADEVAVMEREELARKLASSTPNSFFTNQADNLDNRSAYIDTLAQDILQEVKNTDYIFGAIGTGGSLSGTAEGVKRKDKKVKVAAVEPVGSTFYTSQGKPYFQSGTGNPVGADLPKNVNLNLIDRHYYASDAEAFSCCHFLAQKKGILLGGSAGGVLYKAIEFGSQLSGAGKIVVLLADGGEKYVSTIFNPEWMKSHRFLDKKVMQFLEENV